MSLQDLTALFVVMITLVSIVYDVWVKYKDPTGESTISWVVLKDSKKWPIVAFAFGFLMGHIFAPNC